MHQVPLLMSQTLAPKDKFTHYKIFMPHAATMSFFPSGILRKLHAQYMIARCVQAYFGFRGGLHIPFPPAVRLVNFVPTISGFEWSMSHTNHEAAMGRGEIALSWECGEGDQQGCL